MKYFKYAALFLASSATVRAGWFSEEKPAEKGVEDIAEVQTAACSQTELQTVCGEKSVYDTRFEELSGQFSTISAEFDKTIANASLLNTKFTKQVEHFKSLATPGSDGKSIYDIQISYEDLEGMFKNSVFVAVQDLLIVRLNQHNSYEFERDTFAKKLEEIKTVLVSLKQDLNTKLSLTKESISLYKKLMEALNSKPGFFKSFMQKIGLSK